MTAREKPGHDHGDLEFAESKLAESRSKLLATLIDLQPRLSSTLGFGLQNAAASLGKVWRKTSSRQC
jgi:hypothetical protein